MKRLLLALVISLTATAACAGDKTVYYILPPPEFDHPYIGQLTILRVPDQEGVRRECPEANFSLGVALACTRHSATSCVMVLASDDVIQKAGFPPELVLRHELAHCNGWPGDHKDALPWKDWAELPPPPKPAPPEAALPPTGTEALARDPYANRLLFGR